jgi:hypothetical protein
MSSYDQPDGTWFSILVHKLLRRDNFTSKAHLKQRIEAFIVPSLACPKTCSPGPAFPQPC